jgi:hypothetical protein
MPAVYIRDIVPPSGLRHHDHFFSCQICQRTFERGGRREGFVKSGASNHALTCREIVAFLRGFVLGGYDAGRGAQTALPAAEADPYTRRRIQANIARRKRESPIEWQTLERYCASLPPISP